MEHSTAVLPDEHFVLDAQSGDPDAFNELVRRYFGTAYAIAYSRVQAREAAEDLAQEAFVRAYLNLRQLKQPGRFAAWVARITRNLACTWTNSKKVRSEVVAQIPIVDVPETDALATTAHSPREAAVAAEQRDMIAGAMMALPDHLREVVLLHFGEGLTKKEIAAALGIHPANVGRRLDKALAELHTRLEPLLRESACNLRSSSRAVTRAMLLIVGASALPEAAQASITLGTASAVSAGAQNIANWLAGYSLGTKAVAAGAATIAAAGIFALVARPPAAVRAGTTGRLWQQSGQASGIKFERDRATGHLKVGIDPLQASITGAPVRSRIGGWFETGSPEMLPYSQVGEDKIVRAKFYVYATGQQNPAQKNQIPVMQFMVGQRFAAVANLEVSGHNNAMPQTDVYSAELTPSTDPMHPSVYRVDLDPFDVPYMKANAETEGISRAFSVCSTDPQDNGYVALAESIMVTYPRSAIEHSQKSVRRIYSAAEGDLDAYPGLLSRYLLTYPGESANGEPPTRIESAEQAPSVWFDGNAMTYDSRRVPQGSIGVLEHHFSTDRGGQLPPRMIPRISPGKQYKFRFHVTGDQQSNLQCPFWMMARTIGFAYLQKLELGGAYAVNDVSNPTNRLAWQIMPGHGTYVFDGWYEVLMVTPLHPDIRADQPPYYTMQKRMPAIMSQPGPRENKPSIRDIANGVTLIDTLNFTIPNAENEAGNYSIDRVEVHEFELVAD